MPEKKLYDLTVDPEFRDLIPPLNEEELKLLEESLVADGCESPLIVWNGVIIDGHNRYAICQKHGMLVARVDGTGPHAAEHHVLWLGIAVFVDHILGIADLHQMAQIPGMGRTFEVFIAAHEPSPPL